MSYQQRQTTEREEFGFERTHCSCETCVVNCENLPGYLIPADTERISRHLGYKNLGEFARDHLLASPGATVIKDGRVFQIPTLVPRRKSVDGTCTFLTPEGRCSIHAVAPFGCAFFHCTQPAAESDRRSMRGLQEVARAWTSAATSFYAVLWKLLYEAGAHAIPAHVARARMEAEGREKEAASKA